MGLVSAIKHFCQDARKWTWHHLVAFLITYSLYAMYHACRKAFSNIKDLMGKSFSPFNSTTYPYETWQQEHMFSSPVDANEFFGELDFLFLLAYAIGLYVSGIVGDRVDLRHMLSAGIIGSSLVTFTFGYLSVPLNIHTKIYYRILFFLNGLFQSTGWPALIAVMGNWFSKTSSGFVFGIWSTNTNTGNMIGSFIVSSVIDYGYEYGMLLNSIFSFCGGVITFFCLIPHPNDIGLPSSDEHSNTYPHNNLKSVSPAVDEDVFEMQNDPIGYDLQVTPFSNENLENTKTEVNKNDDYNIKPIKFYEACLIPGVLPYALSYACLKMVTYAFFFWLPTYLTQGLKWPDSTSDKLSNFYDVGGLIGSILSGVISDFVGYRSPVVSCMLFLSIGSVYAYATLGSTYIANVTLMVICGCMLGGPASLICTAISSDLGKNDKIAGNTQALATVSGIIDGTGSLGAAIGQYLVGVVSKYYGWHWVFNFLLIMITLSFTLVIPMFVKDFKTWRRRNTTVNLTVE